MSTALHYKSNLRDVFFNLFELHDIGRTSLGTGPFAAMDEESARDALQGLDELCRTELAASFADSDRTPLTQDAEGNVVLPASLKKSLNAYWDAQWHLLELPEHLGGFGAPPSVNWSAFELVAGANASACFYLFGNVIAKVIDRLATPAQKARLLGPHIERRWGGSMVLTEPDAGSDVGAGRTRARQVDGEVWEITGTKRFITNGDFDVTENILHLVLARPEGADVGTKGLSLFIVPKFWVNEDGSLGERNGVRVSKVEKKMGIKASSTCEMVFGEDKPARGWLMGEVHDGIRQMFQVIEQARMAVGIKSMATLSTAYLNALEYAKDRVQGADLAQAADKRAPRVRILQHPDVRRMLLACKAHAEGMRALALFTAYIQDQVEIQGGHGASEAARLDALNDLLLPLVKGYSSEKATEMLGLALQVIGGSGYIQDYPFEQYMRDQKIDSLYEGTTHIQALDLLFRKILRDQGRTFQQLLGRIVQTLEKAEGGEALATERAALQKALGDVQGIFVTMVGKLEESPYHAGLQGNRILFAVAELVIGWLLVRQAAVALGKLPEASRADKSFYEGKIAAVRWYCQNVLPTTTMTRKLIEAGDLSVMDVPEEAF
jgi:alkylation response protein AidB-like acyl-CoA dehydrogenase